MAGRKPHIKRVFFHGLFAGRLGASIAAKLYCFAFLTLLAVACYATDTVQVFSVMGTTINATPVATPTTRSSPSGVT